MKVTDNRTITVEIDGKKATLSLSDLQRLYDMIGGVVGISRHGSSHPFYQWPYRTIYGAGTVPCSTGNIATISTGNTDHLVLNSNAAA